MTDKHNETMIKEGLSMLEKAVRYKFMLMFFSLTLAADVFLSLFYSQSLFQFDLNGRVHIPLGSILIFFSTYLVAMTVVFPALRTSIDKVLWGSSAVQLIKRILLIKNPSQTSYEQRYLRKMVPVDVAELDALENKDAFWIERVNVEKKKVQERKNEQDLLAGLSFSCFVLMMIDAIVLNGVSSMSMFHRYVFSTLSEGYLHAAVAAIAVIYLLLIFPWIYDLMSKYDYCQHWIKHPRLAQEQYKKLLEK
jgi:hypothetical protein